VTNEPNVQNILKIKFLETGVIVLNLNIAIYYHDDYLTITKPLKLKVNEVYHRQAIGIWIKVGAKSDDDILLNHLPDRRRLKSQYVGRGWQHDSHGATLGHGLDSTVRNFF